ncbi:MAG: hypothetical protein L3K15_08720 [Thermoplasmata archaeon]|nr:hypothetical protein [Thermoplasmata archaeon]
MPAGAALVAAGLMLVTIVEWYLAGYLGPTGNWESRLSIYYEGLALAYALQASGFFVGAFGWAVPDASERRPRGGGPLSPAARRWRLGRWFARIGGLVAGGAQFFNAATLAATSAFAVSHTFVLLTPEVQIIPSLLVGVGLVLFAVGWSLRKAPSTPTPGASGRSSPGGSDPAASGRDGTTMASYHDGGPSLSPGGERRSDAR